MPYERLLQQKRIKAHEADPQEIKALLDLANRDLDVARKTLGVDSDWAYTIAYNAILQASRALMFSNGFRPRGSAGHITVVQFMRESLGKKHVEQVNLLDQMRRKRHRVLYDETGLVGDKEAEQSLAFAKSFVKLLTELCTGKV
ncbi:MAG: HEPN domain-containing protein [Anaerolineales bacterium]